MVPRTGDARCAVWWGRQQKFFGSFFQKRTDFFYAVASGAASVPVLPGAGLCGGADNSVSKDCSAAEMEDTPASPVLAVDGVVLLAAFWRDACNAAHWCSREAAFETAVIDIGGSWLWLRAGRCSGRAKGGLPAGLEKCGQDGWE
jgi:hypothetical protein